MITPQIQFEKLATKIGLNTPLYLKREDLHPLLSHKGRSIPAMIEYYLSAGVRNFVIASSGNAAIAAAITIAAHNHDHTDKISLTIFVGKKINADKLKILQDIITSDPAIEMQQVSNPKQTAFQSEKDGCQTGICGGAIKNLRQSTDDIALVGYTELAQELAEIKNLSAVFIPTSSGTTAQGLYEAFQKIKINPQIHIVQTSACHPLVTNIATVPTNTSLAGAIVDKIAHRKNKILTVLKNSQGLGWVATDAEIKSAIELVKQTANIEISTNSALAIVGLQQALAAGHIFSGPVVCIFTGK